MPHPDALNNVISTINQILRGNGRLITVVGCGGNRDKGKRPMMAREAVDGSWKYPDFRIIRDSEEPQDIFKWHDCRSDLMQNKKVTIVDRREAIKTACALAQTGDGTGGRKGHED